MTAGHDTRTTSHRKWLASLVGIAAVVAATLAWIQADAGRRGDDASAVITLRNIDIFVDLAAYEARDQFRRDATRRAVEIDQGVIASFDAADPSSAAYRAVALGASVDAKTAKQLLPIEGALTQVPASAPGVDAPMLNAIATPSPAAVDPLIAEAQRASERAASYGTRASRAGLGLAITAIAVALLGLSGLVGAGRPGRLLLVTGGVALLGAVALGIAGLVG